MRFDFVCVYARCIACKRMHIATLQLFVQASDLCRCVEDSAYVSGIDAGLSIEHCSCKSTGAAHVQGMSPPERVEQCMGALDEASHLLGLNNVLWLRVRQLLVNALHDAATAGEASSQDLALLVRVCSCLLQRISVAVPMHNAPSRLCSGTMHCCAL